MAEEETKRTFGTIEDLISWLKANGWVLNDTGLHSCSQWYKSGMFAIQIYSKGRDKDTIDIIKWGDFTNYPVERVPISRLYVKKFRDLGDHLFVVPRSFRVY